LQRWMISSSRQKPGESHGGSAWSSLVMSGASASWRTLTRRLVALAHGKAACHFSRAYASKDVFFTLGCVNRLARDTEVHPHPDRGRDGDPGGSRGPRIGDRASSGRRRAPSLIVVILRAVGWHSHTQPPRTVYRYCVDADERSACSTAVCLARNGPVATPLCSSAGALCGMRQMYETEPPRVRAQAHPSVVQEYSVWASAA
jgi:hypothetical protein